MPDSTSQIVRFEVEASALDKPTTRRRWNGGAMASKEASDALRRAVEAFQASLRADGFEIAHTGCGVVAEDVQS
jgi:hypothetical protein